MIDAYNIKTSEKTYVMDSVYGIINDEGYQYICMNWVYTCIMETLGIWNSIS